MSQTLEVFEMKNVSQIIIVRLSIFLSDLSASTGMIISFSLFLEREREKAMNWLREMGQDASIYVHHIRCTNCSEVEDKDNFVLARLESAPRTKVSRWQSKRWVRRKTHARAFTCGCPPVFCQCNSRINTRTYFRHRRQSNRSLRYALLLLISR